MVGPTGSRPRGPIRAIRRLLAREGFRFLLVGGFNTVVGYGIFVLIELTFGSHTSYLLSLYVAYFIGTIIAFITHRRITFQISGGGEVMLDYFRFLGVSVVSLAVNTIALPLLVEVGHLTPIAAQAIVVVVTTLISYVGHKFFSFRRARRDHSEASPAD